MRIRLKLGNERTGSHTVLCEEIMKFAKDKNSIYVSYQNYANLSK